jgi:hypothetical protein
LRPKCSPLRRDLLDRREDEFEAAAAHVLEKNRDLPRTRLAARHHAMRYLSLAEVLVLHKRIVANAAP